MSHSIFGWDLPPGCRVSDIPGNRPEDVKWEAITEGFYDGNHISNETLKKFEDAKLDSDLDEIITKAIEYGIEIGIKEEKENSKFDNGMYVNYLLNRYIAPILFKTDDALKARKLIECLSKKESK
jgi:hypothetical protein